MFAGTNISTYYTEEELLLELYACWFLIFIYPDKGCWVGMLERLLSLQQTTSLPIHKHTPVAHTHTWVSVLMLANERLIVPENSNNQLSKKHPKNPSNTEI